LPQPRQRRPATQAHVRVRVGLQRAGQKRTWGSGHRPRGRGIIDGAIIGRGLGVEPDSREGLEGGSPKSHPSHGLAPVISRGSGRARDSNSWGPARGRCAHLGWTWAERVPATGVDRRRRPGVGRQNAWIRAGSSRWRPMVSARGRGYRLSCGAWQRPARAPGPGRPAGPAPPRRRS
jgi:hypothetical protein